MQDPGTDSWTSEDPLGFAGGPNLYEYSSNIPTVANDPLGLLQGAAENPFAEMQDAWDLLDRYRSKMNQDQRNRYDRARGGVVAGNVKVYFYDKFSGSKVCGQTFWLKDEKKWVIAVNPDFKNDPRRLAAILSHEFWHLNTRLRLKQYDLPDSCEEEIDAYTAEVEMYALLNSSTGEKYYNKFENDLVQVLNEIKNGVENAKRAFCDVLRHNGYPNLQDSVPGYNVNPKPLLPTAVNVW